MFKKYITDPLFLNTAKVDSIALQNKNVTDKLLLDKKDFNQGRTALTYGEAIAQGYNEARARAKNEAGKARNAQAIHELLKKIHEANDLRRSLGLAPMPFNAKDIEKLVGGKHDKHMRARQTGPYPLQTNAELLHYLKARKEYLRTAGKNRGAVAAPYKLDKDGNEYTTVQGFGAPTWYSDDDYYSTDMNLYAESTGNIPGDMDKTTVMYPGLANSRVNPFTSPKVKVPDEYTKNWNFSLDLNLPDTDISYTPPSLQTKIPGDTWYETDKRLNLSKPTYEPK